MSGFGFGNGNGNEGTEFLSVLPPPGDALRDYDSTKTYTQQTSPIPQIFLDAMSVREEVFGQQGVPLDVEFDQDDARSWHWVVYASVASTASPPASLAGSPSNPTDDARRPSASASRVPVGTIRLIPPPHAPNPYTPQDKHPDADPPREKAHPAEPYIKLGRLAVLSEYRALGLSKLLINAALDYASKNGAAIRPPLSPTTLEKAHLRGRQEGVWRGLAMVHAQTSVAAIWAKHGFSEELVGEGGEVEVRREERWVEEGIEHLGMWKRVAVDGRL